MTYRTTKNRNHLINFSKIDYFSKSSEPDTHLARIGDEPFEIRLRDFQDIALQTWPAHGFETICVIENSQIVAATLLAFGLNLFGDVLAIDTGGASEDFWVREKGGSVIFGSGQWFDSEAEFLEFHRKKSDESE